MPTTSAKVRDTPAQDPAYRPTLRCTDVGAPSSDRLRTNTADGDRETRVITTPLWDRSPSLAWVYWVS